MNTKMQEPGESELPPCTSTQLPAADAPSSSTVRLLFLLCLRRRVFLCLLFFLISIVIIINLSLFTLVFFFILLFVSLFAFFLSLITFFFVYNFSSSSAEPGFSRQAATQRQYLSGGLSSIDEQKSYDPFNIIGRLLIYPNFGAKQITYSYSEVPGIVRGNSSSL